MEDRSGGIDRGVPVNKAIIPTKILDEITSETSYPLQRTANKRSFDVAFLVAPDENLARRQTEKMRLQSVERVTQELKKDRVDSINSEDQSEVIKIGDLINDRIPQNLTIKHFDSECDRVLKSNSLSPRNAPYITPRTLTPTLPGLSPEPEIRRYTPMRLQKSPSPPGLFALHQQSPQTILRRSELLESNSLGTNSVQCGKVYDSISCLDRSQGESRSAFTKVTLGPQRNGYDDVSQASPRSSISPDRCSYQSSVSPPTVPTLPGATSYKYSPSFPSTKMSYPFLMTAEHTQSNHILENLKIPQVSSPPKVPSPKLTPFRPDLPGVYPNLPYNPISAVFPPMAEALTRPRFLATAAGVAGLLPPSFAALSLPAQNVCAKCNLSFRMTSDLVYHMRSHHKSESVGESARRRREEKLRCPVCDESFRERHHLTRHMTAHQDKESDAIVDQIEVKRRSATIHGK